MHSSRKPGFFKLKNEGLESRLQTLQKLLLDNKYDEAKIMLESDPDLYDMSGRKITDADGNHFPKISLFALMLWKRDLAGINTFLHSCDKMPNGDQYNALNKINSALEKFIKSGTVVIINGVKHKKHHGMENNPVNLNVNDLTIQVIARMEVLREAINEDIMRTLLNQ